VSKVVDLKQYRTRKAEFKSYGAWQKRFGEIYTENTRLADLSHRVVSYLATPGDDSNRAFYELIMGTLDYGPAAGFYSLGSEEQLKVVDIHLFLADQVRFEMMRRIGWIAALAAADYALIELVRNFDRLKIALRNRPPELAATHPEYEKYKALSVREREVFVRQMLRSALDQFVKNNG
jgi:hypothetical protein